MDLHELRRKRQLTQKELAKRVGVSTSTIARIEQGRHVPRLATRRKLARVLQVDVASVTWTGQDADDLVELDPTDGNTDGVRDTGVGEEDPSEVTAFRSEIYRMALKHISRMLDDDAELRDRFALQMLEKLFGIQLIEKRDWVDAMVEAECKQDPDLRARLIESRLGFKKEEPSLDKQLEQLERIQKLVGKGDSGSPSELNAAAKELFRTFGLLLAPILGAWIAEWVQKQQAKAAPQPSQAPNDTEATTKTGDGVHQGAVEELSLENPEVRRQAWLKEHWPTAQETTEMGNGVHQDPTEDVSVEDLESAGKHGSGSIRLSMVPRVPASPS